MVYKHIYKNHIRPEQAQLISLMELDRDFVSGSNNWLIDEKNQKYLDFTGSYGANTLGHGNIIRGLAANYLRDHSLSFLQGHQGLEASKLALTISNYLSQETGEKEWISQFANSGAESVEIALKIAKYRKNKKIEKKKIKLQEAYNQIRRINEEKNLGINLEELETIKKANNLILNKDHKIVALKNAFHGKTNEALKVTYNESLKKGIVGHDDNIIQTEINNTVTAARLIEENKEYIINPFIKDGVLQFQEEIFYNIAAFILEPIQGEGGVFELSTDFVKSIKEQATRVDSLLIMDEIQTGCFRTGRLAYSTTFELASDIYTFSKGLSAGFSKCGLCVVNAKVFPKGFDLIQSSTFAEDDLSSFVANKTLKLANSYYQRNEENIKLLKRQLNTLQEDFPQVISDVRGQGLMLSFELSHELTKENYEFKYFGDAQMFGYLISSALLNNEKIRVAPTLSNQMTLRVQPSINVSKSEIDFFINGIKKMINAIINQNSNYFFSHLFQDIEIGNFNKIPETVRKAISQKIDKATYFLNHPIKTTDVKKIVTAFKNVPDEMLEELMHATFKLQKFTPYFATEIVGDNGNKTTIVMLSIPVTSKVLYEKFRSQDNTEVINKAQDAILYAKENGGSTVGLGQFTSIVTKNGMFLDNLGLNLTTGNSYTAKLAYDAGRPEANKVKPNIGFVGYGGNIITTMVSLAIRDAKKIILFHRGKTLLTNKILACLHELVHYVASQNDIKTRDLRLALSLPYNTMEQLLHNISDYIIVTNSLDMLNECDIVYTGTNCVDGLFNIDALKDQAHVVDLAVPGDFYGPTETNKKSITHTKGGIAKFPKANTQSINIEIPSFPLGINQSFACMAETFSYGLSGNKDNIQIGPISISDIQKISKIAKSAGFEISGNKTTNSL